MFNRLTGLRVTGDGSGLRPVDGCALFLLVCACVYALLKPIWDWDVIPYVALAYRVQGMDWVTAHTWAYAWVDTLPAVWREDLMSREFYRAAVAADAESLRQVSVFYQARVGYYGVLSGLAWVGVPVGVAVQGINLGGQVILGAVMWVWMRGLLPKVISHKSPVMSSYLVGIGILLLYAFLLFNPTVMKLARWSSPDGIVAGLYVFGVYLAWWRRDGWAALPWAFMVLMRPNTALWLMPLAFWAWFEARRLVVPLVGVGALSVALQGLLPNYPLAVLWQHTFGFPYVYPAGVKLDWGFDVFKATFFNRMASLHGRDLVVWGVMAACVGWAWFRQLPARWLVTAMVVGACLQVLVFPAFWERYFGGVAVGVLLFTMEGLRPVFNRGSPPTRG